MEGTHLQTFFSSTSPDYMLLRSIQSNVALLEGPHVAESTTNSSFIINVTSPDDSAGLTFKQLPQSLNFRSELQARQSFVSVPPQFEGKWKVQGSHPYVYWSQGKDPSGMDRYKNFTLTNSTNTDGVPSVKGSVWWMDNTTDSQEEPELRNVMNVRGAASAVLHLG